MPEVSRKYIQMAGVLFRVLCEDCAWGIVRLYTFWGERSIHE